MKNKVNYIYGTFIVIIGAFLFFAGYSSFIPLKNGLGYSMVAGAIIAFFEAMSRRRKQVEFSYHAMHALALLIYGLSILSLVETLEDIRKFSFFLFIFYTFSEIIFSNWLFNLSRGVVLKIVFIRVFLGLLVGVASIFLMFYKELSDTNVIEGYGVVFIIIGVNIILYEPVMNKKEINELEE